MEKSLCLLLVLCSALLEVQSLECYVCDNCSKAKLDDIKTCGPTMISGLSTTILPITESSVTTTVTTRLPTTSTSTTLKPTTVAVSEFTTTSTTITTEAISTSTTTEAPTTTEAGPTSIESTTTPIVGSSTAKAAVVSSNTADSIPLSTDTISDLPSTATESQQITPATDAAITSASMITLTDATISFITSSTEPAIFKETSEAVIITEKEPIPTDSEILYISSIPTRPPSSVPVATFPVTEPTIQTFSTLPTLAEQNTEQAVQNIPNIPILSPVAAEPMAANEYMTRRPTINNLRPEKETNATSSSRRMRSSSEPCACKHEEKCDCSTHQRSKRYTLRGLGLTMEPEYVCFVDKYKINETEIVKRGCAIKEADEKTLCTKLGFGRECKICDTHQCNSAAILQASVLLMFSLCFI
ncbi:cell wall protein DAN4-like [Leguminivora glycinivorella]|uniref:cell wall protein DAN4-like n=1 Tax=Leguminivora glycinivorella TaxID=1035111 RepID=UPI00200BC9BA|nr:cell wall protein DAN4-like [Leguminivora glycinivorella]